MQFTDEDLNAYKYALKNVWAFKSNREKMEALIVRLESAETRAETLEYALEAIRYGSLEARFNDVTLTSQEIAAKYLEHPDNDAWQKVAGK